MPLWRWTIVVSTCVALGCAAIGLVEWFVLAYGITDLECAIDPMASNGCAPPWEPTPRPRLMAASGFAALATVGIARIELHGLRDRFRGAPALG